MILLEDDLPRSLPIGQVSFKFKSYLPSKEIVLSCATRWGFFHVLIFLAENQGWLLLRFKGSIETHSKKLPRDQNIFEMRFAFKQ